MIDKVSFTNFKSLRRVAAELRRFMVIVGPNGSGKTSLLDGLHYLAQATQRPLASIMSGVYAPPNLLSRGTEGPMTLALSGRLLDATIHVEAVVTFNGCTDAQLPWSASVTRRWGEVEDTAEPALEELSRAARLRAARQGKKMDTARPQSVEMARLARE